MDTTARHDPELRQATVEKKHLGCRCLEKQRDGNYALSETDYGIGPPGP